jgi:uncharacterized protein
MSAVEPQPVTADPPPLDRRVIMRQRWTELAYLHWRYPPDVVQAHLPDGVTVDTFDGDAWVGLIPFVMRDVRVGPVPPLPYLSTFVEINVRTYVVDERGRRAVWFWSLDVPRALIVAVARTCFSLPYCWSAGARHDQSGDRHRYTMRRTWPRPRSGSPRATADLCYTVGEPIVDADVTDLDHFLTARWALVTARRGRIRYGRIHHERWPLHRMEDLSVDQTAIEATGLPSPVGPPHTLCTPGVGVSVNWLE